MAVLPMALSFLETFSASIQRMLPARKKLKRVQVPKVNLYPIDPFYQTVIGRALRWAVGIGRHIVIFTELVVIVSFASRFVLDRQLTDLNRSILQKQSIVESYGDLEEQVRALQARSEDLSAVLEMQGRYRILEILAKVTPQDVTYEQISLTDGRLNLQGMALSNRSLDILIAGLTSQKDLQNIAINGIQSGSSRDPGVEFRISALYRAPSASPTPSPAKATTPKAK